MKSKEIERTRGEGGGRHRYRHVEGDVPLCMRKKVDENEAKSKENEKSRSSREKCDGGSKKTTQTTVENESKGTRSSSTKANKTTSESKSEKDITFIILQKNKRSLNSSERFEELTQEVEGCRWDATIICETWRASNAEIWETQQGHIFMGSGKFENKHGVGILVNKKWRNHINWTDDISERAMSTSITVNKL